MFLSFSNPASPTEEEGHYVLELVVCAARGLFFLIAQECGEPEHVLAFDVGKVQLVARLSEIGERRAVPGVRLRLLAELDVLQVLGDGAGERSVSVLAILNTTVTPLFTAFSSASLRWRRALASAAFLPTERRIRFDPSSHSR